MSLTRVSDRPAGRSGAWGILCREWRFASWMTRVPLSGRGCRAGSRHASRAGRAGKRPAGTARSILMDSSGSGVVEPCVATAAVARTAPTSTHLGGVPLEGERLGVVSRGAERGDGKLVHPGQLVAIAGFVRILGLE